MKAVHIRRDLASYEEDLKHEGSGTVDFSVWELSQGANPDW